MSKSKAKIYDWIDLKCYFYTATVQNCCTVSIDTERICKSNFPSWLLSYYIWFSCTNEIICN